MNGKQISGVKNSTKIDKEVKTDVKSSTLIDLFRTPCMRQSTLIMYYLWFTNSFRKRNPQLLKNIVQYFVRKY